MAEFVKVLGQVEPAATTLTDLYTVGVSKTAVSSTLVVCEKGAAAATYRIAVSVAGAAIADSQYIAYDAALTANESKFLTIGLTLGAGDVVRVYASTADVTFSLFGVENT
jgi:hypothetical protein